MLDQVHKRVLRWTAGSADPSPIPLSIDGSLADMSVARDGTIYVTNKSGTGFDVIELRGGTSNVTLQWSVTANVADTRDGDGNVLSRFADIRLEPAPLQRESAPSDETLVPVIEDRFHPVPAPSVTTQGASLR